MFIIIIIIRSNLNQSKTSPIFNILGMTNSTIQPLIYESWKEMCQLTLILHYSYPILAINNIVFHSDKILVHKYTN